MIEAAEHDKDATREMDVVKNIVRDMSIKGLGDGRSVLPSSVLYPQGKFSPVDPICGAKSDPLSLGR